MSKELSLSNNITPAYRNSLYYGQFRYVARFYLKEASALRKLDHNEIDKTILFRNSWTQRVTADSAKAVHSACDCLLSLTNPFKTMISSNWVYFYSNTLSDIDYLESNGPMKKLGEITESIITFPVGTVGLKNPQHQFRTYIKSHRPAPHENESLREFINNNKKEIRPSPGLKDFLKDSRRYWLSDGYFIDHNDMKFVTALALINPRLVRKTLPIVELNN